MLLQKFPCQPDTWPSRREGCFILWCPIACRKLTLGPRRSSRPRLYCETPLVWPYPGFSIWFNVSKHKSITLPGFHRCSEDKWRYLHQPWRLYNRRRQLLSGKHLNLPGLEAMHTYKARCPNIHTPLRKARSVGIHIYNPGTQSITYCTPW